MGGTGSPSPRLPWLLAWWQPGAVALDFVARPLAPRATAQAPMHGAQVGWVQGQVGPQLATDDVVDSTSTRVAAQGADVGCGQYPGRTLRHGRPVGPPLPVRCTGHRGLRRRRTASASRW